MILGRRALLPVLLAASLIPLSNRVEVSILDRGSPATGRAAELRQALRDQLGLVLRYRSAEAGRQAGSTRERISARVREHEDDQADLVAAVRAGAAGLAPVTASDRDPTRHVDSTRSGQTGPVLNLGSR